MEQLLLKFGLLFILTSGHSAPYHHSSLNLEHKFVKDLIIGTDLKKHLSYHNDQWNLSNWDFFARKLIWEISSWFPMTTIINNNNNINSNSFHQRVISLILKILFWSNYTITKLYSNPYPKGAPWSATGHGGFRANLGKPMTTPMCCINCVWSAL